MHERRVERVLIALPWMPCRRACALCPTACAPVCAPRSTNGPLLSRAGGCDKLRRCHRDDERIVLRLRVTVRVESARAAESALSIARPNRSQIYAKLGGSRFLPFIRFLSTGVFRVAQGCSCLLCENRESREKGGVCPPAPQRTRTRHAAPTQRVTYGTAECDHSAVTSRCVTTHTKSSSYA